MTDRKNNAVGIFCGVTLVAAFIYGLVLPFMWGNDPLSETGTLSLLCEDRKVFFWLWGILTSAAVIFNSKYLYKKYEYKNRFFDSLFVMAFLSMCGIALSLDHSIADWNPKRIIHWIATGLFIAFIFAPVFLFFAVNIKRHKNFTIYTAVMVLILMSFVVIFVFVGKSALMEMVPIALVEIFLAVMNILPKKVLSP